MRTPLVLLHGSGGTEGDLLPTARAIAADSPVLAFRGTFAIDNGYAFFQRFPDRRIDEADLVLRVPVLARQITEAVEHHGFTNSPLAVGFSNGAVMSAALLMSYPRLLSGAILFRPLAPFATPPLVNLTGIPVLIIDADEDSRRLPEDGRRLAAQLRQLGAMVTHRVIVAGHLLTDTDHQLAREWVQSLDRLD